MQGLLTTIVDYRHLEGCFVAVTEPLLRTILSDQREDLGFTQADVGKEVGLKRGMVSIIERNEEEIRQRGPAFALQFFKAYRFSDAKARDMTRKLFDDVLQELIQDKPPNNLPALPGVGRLVEIPILQAQGGTREEHDVNSRGARGKRTLQLAEVYLDGHKPDNCRVVEVFGYSMACNDLRVSFQPGHRFIIDVVEEPQEGDILVADLYKYGEWHRIFKVFGREGRLMLRSYNDKYEPILLEEGDELVKVGVYINRITEDRAEMRRLNRERLKQEREENR